MIDRAQLDDQSDTPIYRQVFEAFRSKILTGQIRHGERIPPTRELAGLLGLNRTTISAAYELLESEGMIEGQVGRGSFVSFRLPETGGTDHAMISFTASRPSELLFPIEDFRESCREVIQSREALQILQLGPSTGYGPLRQYLLARLRERGSIASDDDLAVTSGCQQALDLVQRVLAPTGETVLLEEPVYPGQRNVFQQGGVRVVGVPVGEDGVDVEALARAVGRERPRLMVITPDFQNPTGTSLPLTKRTQILRLARESGTVIVENSIYSDLRYTGDALPSLKQLDPAAPVIQLGSFSKIAFPGLRVGWVTATASIVRKLAEAKQWCDLHSDQLSQAVLLRFAESGRLAAHHERMLKAGRERLAAALRSCEHSLPHPAWFTRPEGGMNLWIRLAEGLDTQRLLPRAQAAGVSYLPGSVFAVNRDHANALRISFAGEDPARIERGIATLGKLFHEELEQGKSAKRPEPEPALV